VAALAYLLLPVTGLVAYLKGSSRRVRFHGLQAIAIGLLWPLALYACTYAGPGATQAAFAIGGVVWVGFLASSAFGLTPRIPLLGPVLWRAAAGDPLGPDARATGSAPDEGGGVTAEG
jgi:uncharacterized membrane protein